MSCEPKVETEKKWIELNWIETRQTTKNWSHNIWLKTHTSLTLRISRLK